MKMNREIFLSSSVLKISLIGLEKKLIHRPRFVLNVVTDHEIFTSKKKYQQLKRFSQELHKKVSNQSFLLTNYHRSSEQEKEVQIFLKKLKDSDEYEKDKNRHTQIRMMLYNFFKYDEEIKNESQDNFKDAQIGKSKSSDKIAAFFKQETHLGNNQQKQSPINDLIKQQKVIWIENTKGEWKQYSFQLKESSLNLKCKQNDSYKIIILLGMEVTLNTQVFSHILLKNKRRYRDYRLRLDNKVLNKQKQNLNENYDIYLALYTALKQITIKNTLISANIYNMVKIKCTIKPITKPTNESQNKIKQLNFKLNHENYSLNLLASIGPASEIYLPILNNYGQIEIKILASTERKEHNSLIQHFIDKPFQIILPIQGIYEHIYNDKSSRKNQDIRTFFFDTKFCKYQITFDYANQGNYTSYYAYTENDKFEGDQPSVQFFKDIARVHANRIKRILWTIQKWTGQVKQVLDFHRPLLSWIVYILLLITIICFDANNFLNYLLFIMIALMLFFNPYFVPNLKNSLEKLKLYSSLSSFWNKISKTDQQPFSSYYHICLKTETEKQKFLTAFEMNLKKKRNIYKKYKRIQQLLFLGQNGLMQIANFCQKVKNLFCWYHSLKSVYALFTLSLVLFILMLIPLRVIIFIGLLYRLKKGRFNRSINYQINQAIIIELLKVFCKENNLDGMNKYFIQSDLEIDKNNESYQYFDKKIQSYLESTLGLQYQHSLLFGHGKTINQLATLLSFYPYRYRLPLQICWKYNFNEQWCYSPSTIAKIVAIIYGYISNIPSDRYIIAGGISLQDENNQVDDDDEVDDFL